MEAPSSADLCLLSSHLQSALPHYGEFSTHLLSQRLMTTLCATLRAHAPQLAPLWSRNFNQPVNWSTSVGRNIPNGLFLLTQLEFWRKEHPIETVPTAVLAYVACSWSILKQI